MQAIGVEWLQNVEPQLLMGLTYKKRWWRLPQKLPHGSVKSELNWEMHKICHMMTIHLMLSFAFTKDGLSKHYQELHRILAPGGKAVYVNLKNFNLSTITCVR